MFCKAMQKDIMAPESFAIFIKQNKIAYVDEQNAYHINYRVKFQRGPELTTERLSRFFPRQGERWVVKPELR